MSETKPTCPVCQKNFLLYEKDLQTQECASCRAGKSKTSGLVGTCKLCQKSTFINKNAACDDCLKRLGFDVPIPDAEPLRDGCARCRHPSLIRVMLRERTASRYARGLEELAPLAVTFGMGFDHGYFSGQRPEEKPAEPIGILEGRICRRCGFMDLYVQNPSEIPIGLEYGTELLETEEPATPYR